MTTAIAYTSKQQNLLNEFKKVPVKTIIAETSKTNTTNLIKNIVKNKDPILEELMPKFIEYYELTKTKTDKSSFESKFLSLLKNDDDKKYFDDIYNKESGEQFKIKGEGPDVDIHEGIKGPFKVPQGEMITKPFKVPQGDMITKPFKVPNNHIMYQEAYDEYQPVIKPSKKNPVMYQEPYDEYQPVIKPSKKPSKTAQKTNQDLMNHLDKNPTKTPSIKDVFNTGSKLYKDNADLVGRITNSVAKNDGSWLTALSSLEFPEIQILQQITNLTPLAFTKADNELLQRALSRDNNVLNSITGEEQMRMLGKLLFNPDAVGKLIQGRVSNSFDDLKDWGNKIAGIKPAKSDAETRIEDIVAGRIAKDTNTKNKTDFINNARGKPNKNQPDLGLNQKPPEKTAISVLTPPDIHKYGFKDPTVLEDIGNFFNRLIIPTFNNNMSKKEQYIEYLAKTNKPLYERWVKEMKEYDFRKSKVGLDKNSSYDTAVGKKTLNAMTSFLDKATNEPGALKDLTEEQIGDIYDGIGYLKDVMNGKNKNITYQNIQDLSHSIFDELPNSIITKYPDELKQINDVISSELSSSFSGDSSLIDVLTTGDTSAEVEQTTRPIPEQKTEADREVKEQEEVKQEEDAKPEETNPKDSKINTDITERGITTNKKIGDFRPRLSWGGNEVLVATPEETAFMNAVNDAMSLDQVGWGNGENNTLFNINNQDNEKRYSITFSMPPPPKKEPKTTPYNFNMTQQPIFNSQLPPTGLGTQGMRNNLEFGQYQFLSERANLSTTNTLKEIKQNVNEFPHQADFSTGGLPMKCNYNFEYITNQRFLIRR